MPTQSRQLAAIMFTDIVGYTALMGRDSNKALELVRISKEIQKPLVEKHHGQWLKEMGDGAMAKFGTALDAVNCAVEIQELARAKFDGKLRIGIHSGDITIENDDVYGDGVNVAARLESITDPGGIYISESIEKAFQGQTDIQAKYLGEIKLKNVAYGVRTYAVQGVGLPIPDVKDDKELSGHFLAELQRRGVIRAAISYLVVALLLVLLWNQVQDWGMTLPQWSFALLLAVLGVGFPIGLYLAWKFERSPKGFVKTSSLESWQNPYSTSQRKPLTGSAIMTVLILGVAILYLYPEKGTKDSREYPIEIANKSIAVIPFINMSNDPDQEYFSLGIMEAILNHLVKMDSLKVISRTTMMRYQNTDLSVPEIANELGVSHVLEGSVQKSGSTVRINVQLIDGRSDLNLWLNNYDRPFKDIFKIQSEVALEIAQRLQLKLTPQTRNRITQPNTKNSEAYDLYLRARSSYVLFDEAKRLEVIKILERAILLDSSFADAYALYGNQVLFQAGYTGNQNSLEISSKSRDLLRTALKLDPLNSMAYSMMGAYLLWFEWDFEGAEINFLTSLKLAPGDSTVAFFYTDLLSAMGRFEEAAKFSESRIQSERDTWVSLALNYAFLGDKAKVAEYLSKALKNATSNMTEIIVNSTRANLIIGNYEGIIQIQEHFPGAGGFPRMLSAQAIAHFKTGNLDKYQRLLTSLIDQSKNTSGGSPSFYTAMVYSANEEIDLAFEWLEKAYQDHELEMYWLKVEPEFQPLHSDPRWQEMLDKVGFPD